MELNYEEDDLNDDWIKAIEAEEKEYTCFYREPNDIIKIYFTYVNNKNKIYHIKKDSINLDNGHLSRNILINLLKKYKTYNNIAHDVISILQYNIDLEPENVMKYLKQKEYNTKNYLSIKSNFDDIYWKDTISIFKELNSLHILFYEKNKKVKHQTKKVYIKKKIKN